MSNAGTGEVSGQAVEHLVVERAAVAGFDGLKASGIG